MKRYGFGLVLIAAAIAGSPVRADTTLTVYTAFEAQDLQRYKETFERANPGIKLNWVRDSTGVVTAKLLAEKDNPRADVVWGLAASSLLLLKSEAMLEAYAPKKSERLEARFRDKSNPPSWVGLDAWAAALCVNTVELKKSGAPMPKSWADLTKPAYKGKVTMPNPASSGTGFLDVTAWLQMFGEEKGWAYMDALHQNIAAYSHSGSKPCKDAARGEAVIGISFDFRGAKEKSAGAPIEVVVPEEGIGWEAEAAGIIAGTDNLAAAKALLDFTVSDEAMAMYNVGYGIVAVPGIAKPVENFPDNVAARMIPNDFEWAAANRERILHEWSKRYDNKSEPKG
ncbi:putative 2-aminoethylphosphonate ABC transporter substrate-binding protein [Bradyrhizobium prioriisuperbiae]|uniref:putative 2-aminoethylphosphonate ABC transporter substrate-binding protein n=1 Tax=Bradyrhizobium prioriisuperbiae TaxID=2854389 RepID=UPI0028EEE877|nr:putative 2-aminoethylphosphonate ABC transporter substrate-binding protein [Bradyrhizobium prioritasuperba]